jgi:thiamine-phosphate pyrophosphorylase
MTPAVARAVEAARRFVGDAAAIEPSHLLHGLLDEEYGGAVVLATRAGLDYARYLADRPQPQAPRDVPLSGDAESLLFAARELAEGGVLSSEGLLHALVRGHPVAWLDAARVAQILEAERPPPLPVEEPLHLADLTERVDLARALDAGFNRAREALRVVEDYARFALDDAFLTGELKRLRHELATAFAEAGPPGLIESRETRRDVGADLTAEREFDRATLADVVTANLKRLQEALRSLEEFAKVGSPLLAERVERLRYAAYTLERALVIGEQSRRRLGDARLYVLLSGSSCAASLEWTIAEAAAGGAGVVQLREKSLSDRELVDRARQARRWARRAGVLFIVNDRPDVARLVEADGVHLGQDDMTVKDARRILGPDAIIGVSTHSLGQLRQAVLDGANYVGVGPVFPSATKAFAGFPGLEFVRAAFAETSLPAFAIGGVNAETVAAAVAAGATRVAVGAAVAAADDPRRAAAELLACLVPLAPEAGARGGRSGSPGGLLH